MIIPKSYNTMMRLFYFLIFIHSGFVLLAENKIIKIPYKKDIDHSIDIYEILRNNKAGNLTLEFNEGVYHFYPEKAHGQYICISNNDNSYKRVAFYLNNMENVTIKGNNTEFVFHGSIVPFFIQNSKNISISGINIDYDYSFIFEGEVVANNNENKSIDLKIPENVKYQVKDNRLFYFGYDWSMPLGENIVFDKITQAPYYYTSKYGHNNWKKELVAKDMGNREVRLTGFMKEVPPVGSIYTDKGPHGKNRLYPGIILHSSSDIKIESFNIYMAGAMALIGENSSDISMRNFNVKLRNGSNRIISASADATHFVNCRGVIYFDSCNFENMLDDATNVHGVYMKISDVLKNHITVKFGHYQQEGFQFAQKGDTLRIIDRNSLMPLHSFRVKDIVWVNENYGKIYSEIDFPVELDSQLLAVENLNNMPSLIMKNCTIKNNRARSILISTNKSVLIENNYFDSMMAGVLIAGDANNWFESGSVSDVVIRGNTFVNMGKGGENPQSVLQVSPEIKQNQRNKGYYHGRIVFENNIVRTFDSQVIYGLSIKNLIVRNNKFLQSKDYLPIFKNLSFVDVQYCKQVDIYGNTYEGEANVSISAHACEMVNLKKQKGFSKSVVNKPNKFFYQQ